ncbi:MAG TPA: EAL domain-containing protein, partial [Candidatus Binatia bacterium]|nr:EAL domain-containing protein [Candidatus Binatia bacterium]
RFPESLTRPGTTLDQIVDYRVATGQGPLDLAGFRRDQEKRARDGKPTKYKLCLQDGRTILIDYEPMMNGGWVTTHQDVTEVARAEAAIAEQNRRFDAALSNMAQGLIMFDTANRIVVCNDRYIEMYGLSREIVKPGYPLRELLGQLLARGHIAGDIDEYLAAVLVDVSRDKSARMQKTTDGRDILITRMRMAGGGWVATHDDVTERHAAQAKISHMALHDALTGLPNRSYFSEQLEHRFVHMDRDEKFAVLCFDLDRFKSVNDTLGHSFGDKLLRQVGERIRTCLREGDALARLGGDEFAVLQGNVENLTEINALASRLIEVVGSPFDLDGHQAVVGLSIGIAIAPADATKPDELLRNADMALYRAKAEGRGTFRFFEPEMDARMQKRRALELDLRKALINSEFELYYQPIVKLDGDEICGFEALLRWNHPTRGLVPPSEFISLAEETELIIPIGEWSLRQACKEAVTWPGSIGIAVNISSVQFKKRNLAQMVISALASSGLPARRLELEITESVLLFDNESTLETLHQLRSLGVRISMDDFGTGYSSLSYLRSFPFDKIKIDRSFIHDVTTTQDSMAIIRAVTGLGTNLGMATTGEGVETEEELEYLRKEGCTEAQGYFFSQPRPANEVRDMLAKQMQTSKAVA